MKTICTFITPFTSLLLE
jgi:hypothetical protein